MKPLPEHFNDLDVCSAAIALAQAGYFVFPVKGERGGEDPMAWKAPLPRFDWDGESTRDIKRITMWFAGTTGLGVAVDCGKSGLVVIDEDHQGVLPAGLLTPTLVNLTGRDGGGSHYIYGQPEGRRIGGSIGKLPKGFGEVRGVGGYVVLAPSPHPSGRRYRLADPSTVPAVLPGAVAELLPDKDLAKDAATDEEVEAFVAEHTKESRPGLLRAVLGKARKDVAEGAGRHTVAVPMCCWAMKEAKAGLYSASRAVDALGEWFATAVGTDRDTKHEWSKIVAWAVAQTADVDVDDVRDSVEERLPGGTLADLWEALDSYLEQVDRLPYAVALATAATSVLDGEPLWLLLVGAPSSGKTEAVRVINDVADDRIGELTGSASLLSWTKGKDPKPSGLLTRVPEKALACIYDLSPLLASSDRGARDEVYSKLRDVYDGYCRREVGQQPKPLEWKGRLTLLAAVTPAIDNYASHAQALGDRWLYLRLAGTDSAGSIAKALRVLDSDSDHIEKARKRAQRIAAQVVTAARERVAETRLEDQDRHILAAAALVVSRGRAVVPRHGYGRREIDGVPIIEEVPRLARQFGLLVRGLLALGLDRDDAVGAGIRTAVESIPQARRLVLSALALAGGEPLTGAEVARRTGLHRHVVRMQCEELTAIGVVRMLGHEADDDEDESRRTPRPFILTGADGRVTVEVFSAYAEEVARSVEYIHTSPPNKGARTTPTLRATPAEHAA